jgi:hypothetical protein
MKKEFSGTPSRLAAFVFATVLPLAAALALPTLFARLGLEPGKLAAYPGRD